jgi:drug/metabolite transporter (DMT)-like permease
VLWAQTRGALAPIAALRETSVIFGAIIATLVFREPFGRTRIAATVLVVAGIVLLNLGLWPENPAGPAGGRGLACVGAVALVCGLLPGFVRYKSEPA